MDHDGVVLSCFCVGIFIFIIKVYMLALKPMIRIGPVVRIPRFHRGGRGSIPRFGVLLLQLFLTFVHAHLSLRRFVMFIRVDGLTESGFQTSQGYRFT